jgi:hypothetical protein
MTGFWKSSARDKIRNGGVLGGLLGFAIWKGAGIYTFLLENIPSAWLRLGEYSLPIYVIGGGIILGLIIDKY